MKSLFADFLWGLFLYAMFGFGLYGIYVAVNAVKEFDIKGFMKLHTEERNIGTQECDKEELENYKMKVEALENLRDMLIHFDVKRRYGHLESN